MQNWEERQSEPLHLTPTHSTAFTKKLATTNPSLWSQPWFLCSSERGHVLQAKEKAQAAPTSSAEAGTSFHLLQGTLLIQDLADVQGTSQCPDRACLGAIQQLPRAGEWQEVWYRTPQHSKHFFPNDSVQTPSENTSTLPRCVQCVPTHPRCTAILLMVGRHLIPQISSLLKEEDTAAAGKED